MDIMNLLTGITYLLTLVLIIATPIFIIYKLAQKLIEHRVRTEYHYKEYYKAKHNIDDIEDDLFKHREYREAHQGQQPISNTEADFQRWKAENHK